MNEGVGVEKFAEYVFKTADTYVDEASEGRCFVVKAKVTEHADNWAEYTKEDLKKLQLMNVVKIQGEESF